VNDLAAAPGSVVGRALPDEAAPAAGTAAEWLLLAYRLPARPASLRAVVRRKLSAAGAIYLGSACAAAPLSSPAERVMRRMRATIAAAGGSAVLLGGRALAGGPELAGAFNATLDLEYAEVITGCDVAVVGLEALSAAGEFRYQPLWSCDVGLRQLSARFRAVRGQDRFGAQQADAAAAALNRYRSALNDYAARVYAAGSRS
jgi:hypothetical protein